MTKLFVTGFCPTQVKITKSMMKNQKKILKIGLKVVFRTYDVLINGIINKTKIEPPIAKIPPTFICMSTLGGPKVHTPTRSVMLYTSLRVTPLLIKIYI